MERTINDRYDSKCRCCNGQGIQYNPLTGQQERCQECNGTGDWHIRRYSPYGIKYTPYYEPKITA